MCPIKPLSEPSLDTVANRCRVASGAPSAKILYAGHAAVHVSPTHGGMPAIPATRRVIPDDGRLARCSENRAPYRDRLVWSVAPFAVRTDDMGGTLYAMTVCARAVRQRNAGLQAAIGRTVRATAQTAQRFPCPLGKLVSAGIHIFKEILPEGLRLHSNLRSRSRPGLGCEQTETRRPRWPRQSVKMLNVRIRTHDQEAPAASVWLGRAISHLGVFDCKS